MSKQKVVQCSQAQCGKQLTEDYIYVRGDKVYCLTHARVGITGKILRMQCEHEHMQKFGSISECVDCGMILGNQPIIA